MRKLFTIITSAALVAASCTSGTDASAQGPVRDGLRATGEAAATGVRAAGRTAARTGQAAANVGEAAVDTAGRAGRAAANVVGRTGEAAANVVGRVGQGAANVARGTAAGVRALTPGLPIQARAGANLTAAQQSRDARWRFQRHNGEWWYYNPQGNWMYHRNDQWNNFTTDDYQLPAGMSQPQQYSAAYRGSSSAAVDGNTNGKVYQLHTDAAGREYIIDGGRRVYVTNPAQADNQTPQAMNGETPQPALADDANQPEATPAEPSREAAAAGTASSATATESRAPADAGAGGASSVNRNSATASGNIDASGGASASDATGDASAGAGLNADAQ
ncbi:MAG: hypothetical protein KDA44_00820 [Planctomycetales bacterium]|nr:hypothetical protein [Planctomycetales bacterium]